MIQLGFLLLSPIPPAGFMPELADLNRFPPEEVARECVAFNQKYRECLEGRCRLRPWARDAYEPAMREANRRLDVWQTLCYAQSSDREQTQLDCLTDLYRLIGPDAYYRGRMPCPVPPEWFQEIP